MLATIMDIYYFDRETKLKEKEHVYGEKYLKYLYIGKGFFAFLLRTLVARLHFISIIYGMIQNTSFSKRKIPEFVKNFNIDASEFLKPISSYKSFNDFFIRKLKPTSRPIDKAKNSLIIPADGRYLFYENTSNLQLKVKGQKLSIEDLLGDKKLAEKYTNGTVILSRLCPSDYHRFHFPCDCIPDIPKLINGALFSVNPIALKHNIKILSENKRVVTLLHTELFGLVAFIEIGATLVGSIKQTFKPGRKVLKGEEKGYFMFGGSSIAMLFEKDQLILAKDLIELSKESLEIRCKMGQLLANTSVSK